MKSFLGIKYNKGFKCIHTKNLPKVGTIIPQDNMLALTLKDNAKTLCYYCGFPASLWVKVPMDKFGEDEYIVFLCGGDCYMEFENFPPTTLKQEVEYTYYRPSNIALATYLLIGGVAAWKLLLLMN